MSPSAVDDKHLSEGLIGLHYPMRFADLLEARQSGRLLANAAAAATSQRIDRQRTRTVEDQYHQTGNV